jgi:Gpi18-like mannosyltransferase
MEALKKNKLKISLFFAVILSVFLCFYSIWNYQGSTNATNQNILTQHNFGGGGRSTGQGPMGQDSISNPTQGKDMVPPNSASGSSQSNNMTPPNFSYDSSHGQGVKPHNGNMVGGVTSTNSKSSSLLVTYSIIFLMAFVSLFYMFKQKKIKINPKNEKLLITSLLLIGLFLRISLGVLTEGHMDLSLFKNWAASAANNFSGFYSGAKSSDYPPLYIYILFLVGKLVTIPVLSSYFTLIIKIPPILADIATAYLIYRLAKKYISLEISMLISAFYIFNSAIFINSVFWGQVDSFFTFIVVCSIVLMSEGKYALSYILFTAGVLMKPQGIIYLPVLFFEIVRQKKLKNFVISISIALITTLIVILPFSLNKGVTWIFNLFSSTVAEYPYASVNGFNFFSLIGKNYVNDSGTLFIFSYHTWGLIFIVATTLFSWFIYIKGNSRTFASLAALLQIAGVFTLSTRMHERYLFPAVALAILAFIYLKDKRLLLLGAGFSATVYMNTHCILFQTSNGANSSFSPILMITSLLNVLLFAYLIKVSWDIAVRKKVFKINNTCI